MDELSVKSEIKRNVAIVTISGRVDSVSAELLGSQLGRIVKENNKMILDLNGVTYLSSAGVRAIVRTLQSAEKSGGGVVLARVSDVVEKVLETVGMMQMSRVFPSVDDAMEGF